VNNIIPYILIFYIFGAFPYILRYYFDWE